MSDELHSTLDRLAQPGAAPNAAFDALLADYSRFHWVLAVLSLMVGVCVGGFAIWAWRRSLSRTAAGERRWTVNRVASILAALASTAVGLIMALISAANLSNALKPLDGFRGSIGLIGTPEPGSSAAQLHQAFDQWMQSGNASVPSEVARSVDARLAWQRPKAIICAILLVVVVMLAWRLWRALGARAARPGHRWVLSEVGRVGLGLGSIGVGLVLTLMVMGNTQASMAPVAMTLFYG